MALSAVHKVLKHGLISEHNPDAAEAMHCIADAVTLCRFEATDPDNDDVVLSKILHVLLESVRCPTGALLSDDDVCNIVQACYRIGHQSGKESALLRNLSRHTLREIVQSVFKRLPRLSDALNHAHHIDAPVPPHTPASPASPGPQEGADSAEGAGADSKEDEGLEANTNKENEVISPRADATAASDEFTPHGEPFGLACVLEIFRFACSFISLDDPADENAETMCAFGLQLVLSSLESAGDDFAKHPALLTLVQDDLSRAVLAVAPAGNPPVLAATAATVLQMYMVMHHDLKLQLEAFLRVVLLPLAEGPKPAVPGAKTNTGQDTNLAESQRIALECIVDLCRQPEFVPDLYVNYDCDLERPNLFEEVCALLSRSAFPREGSGVGQTNLLCLEGLLAIVGGIADRSADAPPVDGFLVDGEVDFTAPSGVTLQAAASVRVPPSTRKRCGAPSTAGRTPRAACRAACNARTGYDVTATSSAGSYPARSTSTNHRRRDSRTCRRSACCPIRSTRARWLSFSSTRRVWKRKHSASFSEIRRSSWWTCSRRTAERSTSPASRWTRRFDRSSTVSSSPARLRRFRES